MSEYTILGEERVKVKSKESIVNIVLHTIDLGKQVLVFNNSKNRSEATADKIANSIKVEEVRDANVLKSISEKILKSLQNPTKQCRRLAKVVEKGIAFHHSGLVARQRSIIEQGFKDGFIKAISSTPTLAAGLNMPAYKVIINDYKRYSSRGYNDIPVLEYHQMSGRAGRPGKESEGRAVIMTSSQEEISKVVSKFIYGDSEELISKLAVEPTLKMYILSLVAMDMINTKDEVKNFFSNTLYANQYRDLDALNYNIFRILDILKDYKFINQEDDYYLATPIGKKVSELYLNPDTAYYFISNIEKLIDSFSNNSGREEIYSLLYFICDTMEMRPLFRIYKNEEDKYVKRAEEVGDSLVIGFDPFESDYSDFLSKLKTTDLFVDWINEAPEDYINEKYNITPGELHYKKEVVDWLLYCLEEIAIMKKSFFFKNIINKLRIRFKTGIKEELISLITLNGVGRVRARKLFNSDLKKIKDLKIADFATISRVVGDSIAIKIKEQIADDISESELEFGRKPKEIRVREVTDEEVDQLVGAAEDYEKDKEEMNKSLLDF